MSDFDELRRGNFQVDAVRKAAQQEADELGREDYAVDANARAETQEAQDRAEERSEQERAQQRAARAAQQPARDYGDHTVLSRAQAQRQSAEDGPQGGGAVISKRGGINAALRRRRQKRVSSDAEWQRAQERAQRRASRDAKRQARRGRGSHHTFLLLLALIVGLYVIFCLPIDHAISFSREESEGLSDARSWHIPATPYYVLALGSDAREGETTSRTDTMILMRVDVIGGKLTMLSIPRDTMVQIEGHGTQKINAAYAYGGAAGAVREVHELTGAPISQVAVVHFDGIQSLVDYLGGVTVNVPVEVYDPEYTGLILSPGEQVMDGTTAMLFSRVRYGFALGDYQRQIDQRILMQAIMQKMLTLPPTKIPGLVGQAGNMVSTTMRMYSLIPLLVRFKVGMTIYQASVPSEPQDLDGVSYVVADETTLAAMMDVIDAGGDPAAIS